jgi:HSP20 family protein
VSILVVASRHVDRHQSVLPGRPAGLESAAARPRLMVVGARKNADRPGRAGAGPRRQGGEMTTRLTPFVRRDMFAPMFEELFRDFWSRPAWMPAAVEGEYAAFERARMDVVDKGANYEVTVDLPGVKKEEINVSIDGSRVMISAETKTEKEKKEGDKVLYSERSSASYARSFELPSEVTEAGAEAHFDNGVLTLTLPKRTPTPTKRLEIH